MYNNTMFDNGQDLGNRYGQFEFVLLHDDELPCLNNVIKNNIRRCAFRNLYRISSGTCNFS